MRRLALLAVLIGLASACGSVSVHDQPATARRVAAHRVAPSAALLTAAQLRPIVGRVRRTSLTTATVTPDPDPRGPCGARIVQPSIQRGVLVEFERRSRPLRVMQWVDDVPEADSARLIAAISADARPGCHPYSTATPYGHPQRNGFVRAFSLPSVGDQRAAFEIWARIAAPGDRRAYATEIVIRAGNRLTAVTLESLRPVSPALVREIAERTAADLSLVQAPGSA